MIELVGKIGSMALLSRDKTGIDYAKFERIGSVIAPGTIWVSSGAVEIGKLDYISRAGVPLDCTKDEAKTDYAAQGQAILMETYRKYIPDKYSVRQVLVEHQHFNHKAKRAHIKNLLLRAAAQNAIPIVNYNDAVSSEETRKLEIASVRESVGEAVELIDNDETASQVAQLVEAKRLIILTNTDGIYRDISDPKSLIETISGSTPEEVLRRIDEAKSSCKGASREGAFGASAKLEHIKQCVGKRILVYIASAEYGIKDILGGNIRCTRIGIGL